METQIHFSGNSVYWKTFKWGEIISERSTFRTVSRTKKNIFRALNGLGINEELIFLLRDIGIAYIEIPYENKILKTTVTKWIAKGIRSPFASDRVDRQLILPIDKINPVMNPRQINQPSLFGVVL